jgi:glycosylphosphatidylinositol deacylase
MGPMSTSLGRGPVLLGLLSASLLGLFYFSLEYVATNVSPQGCRMSWMHPSSVLMKDFDTRWTRLGGRYTLWLYREKHGDAPWDAGLDQIGNGVPVIFVPGNAGSFKQVRSIASSASRQFYVQPGRIAAEFTHHKPLDFYAG